MLNFKLNYSCQPAERFFIEKSLELLHPKTLDSYRCRINNPKTLLKELRSVLKDYLNGKIQNFDRVGNVISELNEYFKKENNKNTFLKFNSFKIEYFTNIINNKEKKNNDIIRELEYVVKVLLEENKDYLEKLANHILDEIKLKNSTTDIEELDKLNSLITFLITELLDNQFHKTNIHDKFWEFFIKNKEKKSFEILFNNFIQFFLSHSSEKFEVIFRLMNIGKLKLNNVIDGKILSNENLLKIGNYNETSKQFVTKKNDIYISFEEEGRGFFGALTSSKAKMAFLLDILNLSYHNRKVNLYEFALIINENKVSDADTKPIFYETDGEYKVGDIEKFNESLNKILKNNKITPETKQKIISGVRYLRVGNESIEFEQKFVNYWLGLEYIFSTYEKEAKSSFSRIEEYFTICHSLIYVKRNFIEFHQDIVRLKIEKQIPNYNNNDPISYLSDTKTFDDIIKNLFTDYPLLAFRASQFRKLFIEKKDVKKFIEQHQSNLKWNLGRAYRIRNEIVHDAAIHTDIGQITTHLRYYLTFILNNILYFFTQSTKIDESQTSIEDYFIHHKTLFDNLCNQQDIKEFLQINIPVENLD
jgi:hypothetical protein